MLTYEEAYEIAKGFGDPIDQCYETSKVFCFRYSKDPFEEGGCNHTDINILRSDGRRISYVWLFTQKGGTGKSIGQYWVNPDGSRGEDIPGDDDDDETLDD